MPAKPQDCAKYRQRLKERVFLAKGDKCYFCGGASDHFAHVVPTGLNGAGRGMAQRYRDILKHPESYEPMCKKCHRLFDALVRRMKVSEPKEEPIPF